MRRWRGRRSGSGGRCRSCFELCWGKQGAYTDGMDYAIEFELEEDGRWIAEIAALPGVMAYGTTREDAECKVEAMALRVIADSIERTKATMTHVHFAAA